MRVALRPCCEIPNCSRDDLLPYRSVVVLNATFIFCKRAMRAAWVTFAAPTAVFESMNIDSSSYTRRRGIGLMVRILPFENRNSDSTGAPVSVGLFWAPTGWGAPQTVCPCDPEPSSRCER